MHGDPHVVGLKGQKFDFTGQDQGMYNMVHDGDCDLINMRVTALPGTPVITYITGLGMLLCGDDGEQHSIEIEVKEPHNLQTACPSGDVVCLAEGSITMKIDGEEHNQPGEVGVFVVCAKHVLQYRATVGSFFSEATGQSLSFGRRVILRFTVLAVLRDRVDCDKHVFSSTTQTGIQRAASLGP